jgi:hypothetical protein
LYFKSTIQRGQSVDSYFTLNVSPRLNFSIAYKALRSEGRYINQQMKSGNFRFTTSYNSKSGRYIANAHYTSQKLQSEENGGISTVSDFTGGDASFDNRQRLGVYFEDANSEFRGGRFFVDQTFRINSKKGENNLYITQQFNYEEMYYTYTQGTIASNIGGKYVNRFGESYVTTALDDVTEYNKMYNKVGAIYENMTLGTFTFFVDDVHSNYYYNNILYLDNGVTVGNLLSQKINTVGGQYNYRKDKWNGKFLYSKSVTNQNLYNIDASAVYDWNDENQLSFRYQSMNKLPNNNYNLFQSSYKDYNWSHDFVNEKINTISATADTKWVTLSMQLNTINDHLYFMDEKAAERNDSTQIVTPFQYGKSINYASIKASREFVVGRWALDNTLLFQKVDQSDAILNVPEFVTRNTMYYTNTLFNNKLFFQTGIELNYFTSYYSNTYNPIIGEFFVQDRVKIGNAPLLDYFVNVKIQRTRLYLKAEHFNSLFSKNNYFSDPNNPYRDFLIRFGLVWNFFN